MSAFCASGAHVPESTFRSGSRNLPFSARPALISTRPKHRFGASLIGLLTACLALPGCGEETGGERAAPFDFYVLSLSWSPSYCAAEGGDADPQQCDADRDLGFVVHGLWPQFEQGWPEFCDDDTRNPSPAEIDGISDIIPSDGLIRHQWRKHGTCSGLAADGYFDTTRAAFDKVTVPQFSQRRVSAADVSAAFLQANDGLPDDGLAVTCKSGLMREVRICMTTNLEFRACPEVAQRSCRQNDLRLPAP
jgi:ribonuclease T2